MLHTGGGHVEQAHAALLLRTAAARRDKFRNPNGADASAAHPPGLLVRDSYTAYESGATTLRPYANLLRVDVDELRQALEAEEGIPGSLVPHATSSIPSEKPTAVDNSRSE
jgi:hypothetical protein